MSKDDVKYVIINCRECKEPCGEVAEQYWETAEITCEACTLKRLEEYKVED